METQISNLSSQLKNNLTISYNTFTDIKNGIINSINNITNNEEKKKF